MNKRGSLNKCFSYMEVWGYPERIHWKIKIKKMIKQQQKQKKQLSPGYRREEMIWIWKNSHLNLSLKSKTKKGCQQIEKSISTKLCVSGPEHMDLVGFKQTPTLEEVVRHSPILFYQKPCGYCKVIHCGLWDTVNGVVSSERIIISRRKKCLWRSFSSGLDLKE